MIWTIDPSVLDERVTAMELGLILRVLGRLKRDGSPLQEGVASHKRLELAHPGETHVLPCPYGQ